MNWVDYAENGVFNRNNPKDISQLNAEGKQDTYSTYFRFGDDFKDYVLKNSTVKGFKGIYTAEFLPFDIDDEEDLEKAKTQTTYLIERLQMGYDLHNTEIDIYLSLGSNLPNNSLFN